jgi:hypothetical protein
MDRERSARRLRASHGTFGGRRFIFFAAGSGNHYAAEHRREQYYLDVVEDPQGSA